MSDGGRSRMDSSERITSGVHAALRAASMAANSANARDLPAIVELLQMMKELDGELQMSSRKEESELCGLGIEITETLMSRQYAAPEQILPWLARILAHLGTTLNVDLTDEWTSMKVPKPALGTTVELKNALWYEESDGHRLGEILVQMSFLKASDVERALKIQRETNCRLGEAMVMLGLITQKGLEAALKIQQKKRVPES